MSSLQHEAAELPDDVTAYASAVVAGEIVAGPYGPDGVPAASADLETGEARGFYFDLVEVNRVVGVFPRHALDRHRG
jgi:hypothetical protein